MKTVCGHVDLLFVRVVRLFYDCRQFPSEFYKLVVPIVLCSSYFSANSAEYWCKHLENNMSHSKYPNMLIVKKILTCWVYVAEQIQYYERLSPLVPLKSTLGSFSNIKAGDCMVTFSRREIYKLKVGILQVIVQQWFIILGTCHKIRGSYKRKVWEKRSETRMSTLFTLSAQLDVNM